MRRRKLIWHVFPSFLAVIITALAAVAWHSAGILRTVYLNHTRQTLISHCSVIEKDIVGMLASGDIDGLDRVCKAFGKASGTRITVILPDGKVIGDSEQSPELMDNHLMRPEVMNAVAEGTGVSQRRSETLGEDMLYVAKSILEDGDVAAIVRSSLPMTPLEDALSAMYRSLLSAGALVAILAAAASLWISIRITRPICAMKETVLAYADGDLRHRIDKPTAAEPAELVDALEKMAAQLSDRISTVTAQKNQLQQLESIRQDFVANVSHELRTPVTSIKGFVEMLQDMGPNDVQEAGHYLDIIARHTDRLNAIIEDLLSLSAIEADIEHSCIEFSKVNIRGVLMAAVALTMTRAKQKGITVDVTCSHLLDAQVNELLLEQAVVNLIENAVKYSSMGSAVHVIGEREGGMLSISVKDEGCGIAAEHLPRIFERFYVVDKARSRKLGGTGLGLAIVKHIAQSHKGSVEVQSEAGRGSTFTIRVPLRQPQAES